MFDFTSLRPKKQGNKFYIDLGQNNDAYPEKDRMLTQRRGSSKLIRVEPGSKTARSGSVTHLRHRREPSSDKKLPDISADSRVRTFTDYDDPYHVPVIAVDIMPKTEYGKQCRELKARMKDLKEDAAVVRREIEKMYENLAYFATKEKGDLMNTIKDFGKMIKTNLDEAREKKDGLVREFDQVIRDRGIAKKKLKMCDNRIKYLEKIMGVEPQESRRENVGTLEF